MTHTTTLQAQTKIQTTVSIKKQFRIGT